MGVVAETADRVAVMYAGRKVEDAPVEELFAEPRHPYTAGLLGCQPSAPSNRGAERLTSISGSVPDLLTLGEGCPFANRCENASPECHEKFPDITELDSDHSYSCHNPITGGLK
jgi:oligopeptide/dipeptide ABC transporter ATP-binding protein